jgi:hypothetical protein
MELSWTEIEHLLQELIEGQQKHLLQCGRRIVPQVTQEDLLQPNDFPELENHPSFRYEEGVLAGIQATKVALRTLIHRAPR